MATFGSGYVSGLVAILHWVGPNGKPPQGMPGGLGAVDSPQSRNTNLGNLNLHEGTWFRTQTVTGDKYFVFVPKPELVLPKKAVLETFLVQHANGFRADLAPATVLRELTRGVVGD